MTWYSYLWDDKRLGWASSRKRGKMCMTLSEQDGEEGGGREKGRVEDGRKAESRIGQRNRVLVRSPTLQRAQRKQGCVAEAIQPPKP